MKVAVISNQETQQGKSSFMMLLASAFAISQHKTSALFSTGSMKDILEAVEIKEKISVEKSVSVFKTLVETSRLSAGDLYDYAYRVGKDSVFIFDLYSSSLDEKDLENLLMITLAKTKAELSIIDVNGDINTPFNRKVLESVDCVLNIFNHNMKSIEAVKDYINNFDSDIVRRTGYICQKYNPNTISEKKLGSLIQMKTRNFMLLPYNSVIEKEMLNGTLNVVADEIIKGNEEVVNLRSKLLEVMQFLFDTPKNKIIRGVSEWR